MLLTTTKPKQAYKGGMVQANQYLGKWLKMKGTHGDFLQRVSMSPAPVNWKYTMKFTFFNDPI